jgi:hypothetical protein
LQVWRLAWNLITYKEIVQSVRYQQQPIYTNGLRQLAHAAKYLEKLHTTNSTLVASVGDRTVDHKIADDRPLVPEQFAGQAVARPVIEINATTGGADLLGEACSAFAALGILFKEEDPDYANLMIKHARQLYDWMVLVPGTQYSRVHPQLQQTYPSEVCIHCPACDLSCLHAASVHLLALLQMLAVFDCHCCVPGAVSLIVQPFLLGAAD